MAYEKKLRRFFDEIIKEIESNEAFARRIQSIFFDEPPSEPKLEKKGGRRDNPILNPIEVIETKDETTLRQELCNLDLEKLRDIIAGYGMDPAKLAIKWKDKDKVINHIVEKALARAKKGDAFRNPEP